MTTAEPRSHDRIPRTSQDWEDPEQSCGQHFHSLPSGTHYWQAVGPAAEAWSGLSSNIKAKVEDLEWKDPAFSVHMVMVGQSRQTASPRILLCSKDLQMQVAVRDAVLSSGIMTKYPPIGIDFCSNTPEHLAKDVQQESSPPTMDGQSVWAANVKEEFGRRLYILRPDGGPPRITTGGPIFFVGSKAYQTTVGHIFFSSEKTPSPVLPPSFSDFDLESSDSDEESDSEIGDGCDTEGTGDKDGPAPEGCSVYREGLPHQYEVARVLADGDDNPMFVPAAPSISFDAVLGGEQVGGKGKDLEIPRGSVCIGKLVPVSVIGVGKYLNYALVELEAGNGGDRNLISCGRPGSGKKVRVTRPGQISGIDTSITVIVATSSGPVDGKLSTTPAYIKPKCQMECQEMYVVRVDDRHSLEPWDCGSGVIDKRTGELFGHIVFGRPGTNIAYILPMLTIIRDIARAFNQDVFFTQRPKIHQGRHPVLRAIQYLSLRSERYMMRGDARLEPHDVTEFASPKYHKNLDGRKMPKQRSLRGLFKAIQDTAATTKALELSHIKFRKKRNKTFEYLFFSLPPEIRDQIIKELPFRSAMNLRQVSKAWRTEVSTNDSAISKLFLVRNPLPPLAQLLYSNPSPDIQYIQEVGHRHAVASRLAAHIAKWLSQEVYLYRSRYQQRNFQPTRRQIQQRLVPPLFTAFHFFEKYPQFLLQYLRSQQRFGGHAKPHGATFFPFELKIMETYDNDILLQTHQVFKILVAFLRQILRPPSYYGRFERWARGYLRKEPPPQEVHAAILCIGGLDAVAQFADIDDYMPRRAAVDKFYSSLSNPPRDLTSSPLKPDAIGSDTPGMQSTENSSKGGTAPISGLCQEDLQLLLPQLPALDDIWRCTGEVLLLRRKVVEGREDIKDYTQALTELIQPGVILADRLYDPHILWHALSDHDFGADGDSS